MITPSFLRCTLGLSLLLCGVVAQAQGIFVCIDDKGRKITSDRPVPECREKEQRELNPSGTVKRIVRPPQTELEKKEEEAKKKQEQDAVAALEEERRKNRAFVQRYPNQTAHDKERNAALAQVDLVTKSAQSRLDELAKEKRTLEGELEFYKKDPNKAPLKLKRQIEENDKNLEAQKRFVAGQATEKARISTKFDQELARLKVLWTQGTAPASEREAAAAASAKEQR